MHNLPTHFTPPPRRVPLSLAVLNVFGLFSQIGWFVFGFGMVFFWAFVGNADFSWVTFRGQLAHATGKVLRVESTGASENESTIVANHYEYSVAGQRFTGTSYTTGGHPAEGDQVDVEYKAGNPERSRIAGMRTGHFGPFVLFVTIFPLIGFLMWFFSMKGGFKRTRLLRTGIFTTGTLVDKEPTNVTVNDRRVYELTFEFTARDGRRCEAKARTSDTTRLEDESAEPLLYDPEHPETACMLDEVPARPEIDGTGELMGRPMAAVMSLILPGIVIAAHALYFYVKLR